MSENRGLASQITEYLWRKWNPPESVFLVKREVVDCVAGMIDLAGPLGGKFPDFVQASVGDSAINLRLVADRRSERLDIAKGFMAGLAVQGHLPLYEDDAIPQVARVALHYADALLAELDKP